MLDIVLGVLSALSTCPCSWDSTSFSHEEAALLRAMTGPRSHSQVPRKVVVESVSDSPPGRSERQGPSSPGSLGFREAGPMNQKHPVQLTVQTGTGCQGRKRWISCLEDLAEATGPKEPRGFGWWGRKASGPRGQKSSVPIVPGFTLLSSVWAGRPRAAAGVINTRKRMKGSHQAS